MQQTTRAGRAAPFPDAGSDADPFPRDEAWALIRRLPAYGRLAWGIARDPELPIVRRGAVMAAAAYLVSPLDAIPGIIPLIGQLDDVLVLMVALRFALAGLSADRRQRHLAGAGLSEDLLAADLRSLAGIAAWLLRRGGRAGLRASRRGLEASAALARRLEGPAAGGGIDRLRQAGTLASSTVMERLGRSGVVDRLTADRRGQRVERGG